MGDHRVDLDLVPVVKVEDPAAADRGAGAGVAGAAQIAAILSAGKSKAAPSTAGAESDSGGGVGVSASAPLSPQPATTILNPEQVNQMGGSGGRAYVIESDISNNQERTARLNRAARIN